MVYVGGWATDDFAAWKSGEIQVCDGFQVELNMFQKLLIFSNKVKRNLHYTNNAGFIMQISIDWLPSILHMFGFNRLEALLHDLSKSQLPSSCSSTSELKKFLALVSILGGRLYMLLLLGGKSSPFFVKVTSHMNGKKLVFEF